MTFAEATNAPAGPNPGKRPTPRFLGRLSAPQARIWLLIAATWVASLLGAGWLSTLPALSGLGVRVDWFWLAAGFYLAELLVVHLQFRRDAHTLSVSEVPMAIGLLMATPIDLVLGQVVGSAVALFIHRRQKPIKLIFNVGQLVLQTVAAVAVFRVVAVTPLEFDLLNVAGLAIALLAALLVGHGAVAAAIRATGGRETLKESLRVLAVSSAGTVAASLLGVVGAVTLVAAPEIWWIGFVPAVLVFVAYRAYVSQARDRQRISALSESATNLQLHPELDQAVTAAASQVLDLVKAERAAVILFSTLQDPRTYVTFVDSEGGGETMTPHRISWESDLKELAASGRRLLGTDELSTLGLILDGYKTKQAMIEVLKVGREPAGLLAGVNRLGDVSLFTDDDLHLLATLGSQLSTTLENARLSETLAEVLSLKDQLEALVEAKGRLVASVSHELRNPLTGVVGLAAVIREIAADRLDEDTLEMLDLILEQGNELSNILEDLLSHARAEAGTLSIRPEQFDLSDEVAYIASSQNFTVPVDLPTAWAFADRFRVRQVLRNLATNARRYGGPNVRVEISMHDSTVNASVIDDGPGVSASSESSIFEAYKSAHDQREHTGSVGLGLSISRSMAQMMGGDVIYRRIQGETWFTLTLPVIAVPVEV
ncbi:MAG: GAF domain-containing sensor histidine kinase [Acidimicrobiia bacterium]